MCTGLITILDPGIFAPSRNDTPSFGCSVRISWLGSTPSEPSWLNVRWGTGLSVTAISVTLRASRLPVRR